MSLNNMPNEPSQTHAEDDNSFVCPLQWLTDFQCRPLEWIFKTSCATANYVNGIVETNTREPMSLRSFCRGQAVYCSPNQLNRSTEAYCKALLELSSRDSQESFIILPRENFSMKAWFWTRVVSQSCFSQFEKPNLQGSREGKLN